MFYGRYCCGPGGGATESGAAAAGGSSTGASQGVPIQPAINPNSVLATACGKIGTPPSISNELDATGATYLGLGSGDMANAVALSPDCAVLIAGKFSQTGFGVTAVNVGGTADEAGNVYVAGVSAYAIANRSAIKFNGRVLADYAGGDPWVLSVSPDFSKRRLWVTPADGGKGESLGVAALALRFDAPGMALVSPIQSATSIITAATDGYAMVWPGFAP
jgi:hypothetical protein